MNGNNDLQPYIAMAIAGAIGLAFAAWFDYREGPTFEQRWAPVQLIDAGVKGDRLDRKPLPDVPSGLPPSGLKELLVPQRPRPNWLANPRRDTRIACASFCEFP